MSDGQWINHIEIKSSSSDRKYTVSQNAKSGLWGCSCPGWRSRRHCKHLNEMGLPTVERITTPVSRRPPAERNPNFADSKDHYDPSVEGYGNPDEWRQMAENLARGRGSLKVPTARTSRSQAASLAADLALLDIPALPSSAEELLAAMQARAEILNDPVKGNPDEFWRMFKAYERLISNY